MENRIQYKGIDVFKFIMAMFILLAHTRPLFGINNILNFLTADVIGRVTVPFFFAATGFLLEQQLQGGQSKTGEMICNYVKKILKLYCIWSIIYLPLILWDKVVDSGDSMVRGAMIVVRDFVFAGSYAHLWYLPAVAEGVIHVYMLQKYLGNGKLITVLLVLFCMGLLTQSYFGFFADVVPEYCMLWKMMLIVKKIMVTCRNGIFFGSIFIYIGIWVARHDAVLKGWQTLGCFVISLLFLAVEEAYLLYNGYVREQDMYLAQLPAAFFLLLLAIQLPVKAETFFFRKMSMNLYFVHLLFKFIYKKFLQDEGGTNIGLFLFVLVGSLSTSYVMYLVSSRKQKKSC